MGEFVESASVQTGRIKVYWIERNYGFLDCDDGRNMFFHHASIVYGGPGSCQHSRGICARAISLLADDKQREVHQREASGELKTRDFQLLLEGSRVTFRVYQSERGLEARSIKRVQ